MKNRFLHVLTGIIIWILFATAGGALIYANLFRIEDGALGLFFLPKAPGIYSITAGAAMLLLVLIYVLTAGSKKPRLKFVSFESEEGGVSISVNAVRDYIRKIGDEFSAVHSIDPKITSGRDQISIDLDVRIFSGSRVPELSQVLQSRVREGLRDGLGIADVHGIKVRIQEIVGNPPPSRND